MPRNHSWLTRAEQTREQGLQAGRDWAAVWAHDEELNRLAEFSRELGSTGFQTYLSEAEITSGLHACELFVGIVKPNHKGERYNQQTEDYDGLHGESKSFVKGFWDRITGDDYGKAFDVDYVAAVADGAVEEFLARA